MLLFNCLMLCFLFLTEAFLLRAATPLHRHTAVRRKFKASFPLHAPMPPP